MPLKNYTTSVSAERTVVEIMGILAAKGAKEILTEYDDSNCVSGLSFRVDTPRGRLPFRLPVDVDAVHRTRATNGPRGGKSPRGRPLRIMPATWLGGS